MTQTDAALSSRRTGGAAEDGGGTSAGLTGRDYTVGRRRGQMQPGIFAPPDGLDYNRAP